jgi:glycerophosphoryl diester phosphodiesterase
MHRPLIIAHRGASSHAPENTLAAFQLALDHQADGIELDVMLSKDGQAVVIHDDTVDRTTNGSGRVKDLTLADLQALDAGRGEPIPALKTVLDTFGGRYLINIELKNYASPFDPLPVVVAHMLNENAALADLVMVSTFNPFNLARFRKHCPAVKTGLLTLPGKANLWLWRLFRYEALHPHYTDVDQALVMREKARQREVNVWTVDEPEEIRRMAAFGVASIITNDPLAAQKSLEVGP